MTVSVDDAFSELDAVVAELVRTEEEKSPLRGVDAIAVAAIIALSHAGANMLTEASHAGSRDVERLSREGRKYLDRARALMRDFVVTREVQA